MSIEKTREYLTSLSLKFEVAIKNESYDTADRILDLILKLKTTLGE